jgi:teichuronic acid biosynthesis glycosyltransferase TuaG
MHGNSPLVSVIIPTFNSSRTLKWSLESVLRQDMSDLDVWVVGDGCTDDSAVVVDSFGDPRVHWINLPVNSGTPSKPRDEGLRHAHGRLIACLGHDDLWFPWQGRD